MIRFRPGRIRRRSASTATVAVLALLGALLTPVQPAAAAITPAKGVHLTAAHSNKCMNVAGPSTANNAKLIQYTCSPTAANDKWQAVPMGDGTFHLVSVHSNKCANVDHALTGNNVAVLQYTCSATAKHDRWRFRAVPAKPTFQLVAAHSGKCLHVGGASAGNGAALVQFTCGTAPGLNEQWYFPPTVSGRATALPTSADNPVVLVQGGNGAPDSPLVYAQIEGGGTVWLGTQRNPDDFADVRWAQPPNERFTGRPALGVHGDGSVQAVVHNAADGDVWLRNPIATGGTPLGSWHDVGGGTRTDPTVARLPDGKLVGLTLGPRGGLWHLPQDGRNVPSAGWRYLGGEGLGLVGTPSAVQTRTGLRIFALTAAGSVSTAVYESGRLTDWTDLGGAGLNGTVSAVLVPGYHVRLFVRAADGTVVTRMVAFGGTPQTDWAPLGAFVAAGPPAAVFDQVSGRIAVFARGPDQLIHLAFETATGSGVWDDWVEASAGVPASSDPSAVTVNTGRGFTWGFVFADGDATPNVFLTEAGARRGSGAEAAAFTRHEVSARR